MFLVGRGLHFNDSFMDFKISLGDKRYPGRVVNACDCGAEGQGFESEPGQGLKNVL